MFVWVQNELYQYFLSNPIQALDIHKTKNKSKLIHIVLDIMDKPMPCYNSDYRHDWRLEDMIHCLNAAVKTFRRLPTGQKAD